MEDPHEYLLGLVSEVNEVQGGGLFMSLLACFLFGSALFLAVLLRIPFHAPGHYISVVICTFLLDRRVCRDEKKYFKKFEKMSRKERRRSAWITFFFAIGMALYLFMGIYVHSTSGIRLN
jgi:hypothetical protein